MNRKVRTLAISTLVVLWASISLVEANWSMNYPMNGETLPKNDTPGTGNTPEGDLSLLYRIGVWDGEEFDTHGMVTGPNESFGGWYLNIDYTVPGTDLVAELWEGGQYRVGCGNLTVSAQ